MFCVIIMFRMRRYCEVKGKLLTVLLAALVVVVGVGTGLLLKGVFFGKEDSLINISELSEDFMEGYFDEYGRIAADEDKENVLIVTSLAGVKDDYGAVKVIVAPNHQYILQYESEEKKNEARKKFENDQTIASVDNNDVITLDTAAYNSWGVEKMALNRAMEVAGEKDWPEVRVAVIDSGCDVDLVDKYYPGKIVETYDVLNKSAVQMHDTYGHGTHVAGIVAESAPANVGVVPIKVTDGRTMRVSDVVAAINYVVYYEKADVINMSFGLYSYNTALYNAIEAANRAKIISVAAAGNDNTSQSAYPAAYDNTISIASVDSELNKSSFSNYNETVDFAAPGTGIKSTLRSSMTIPQVADGDDDFGALNGTSMAAPHAASAVAVLKSYNQELVRDEAVGLLKDYAVKDLGEVGKDMYYGNGFIYFRPESFCGDAEKDECEEYGVFKAAAKISAAGLEVQSGLLTDRNYGTVNNLNPTQVEVTYSDGTTLMAKLGDLSGVEISGYDPYVTGEQMVTIDWQGEQTSFRIINPEDWESGWGYVATDDKTAKLTGFTDFNDGYNTKKLYLPERIGWYEINELAGATDGYTIFDYADKTSYEEVVLPVTLANISGSQAFRGFSNLKKVTSLAPVLKITGNNVFGYNENLAEVVGTVELSGSSTFVGDTSLGKVALLDSMAEVPANSFNGCSSLKEIELPNQLKVIGDFAFYGAGISTVDLPEGVTKIGEYAFAETDLEKIYVPGGVEEIGEGAFIGRNGAITVWTNTEAYAKTYAVENKVPYEATNVSDVELVVEENSFKAFETVQTGVYVYFDRGVDDGGYRELKGSAGRRETIKADDVEIIYQNGESFRYGDSSFTVRGVTQYGERFEKTFIVTVTGGKIENKSSDYEGIYDGKGHSVKIDVGLEDYEIRYAVGDTDYDLTELPMFTEVGEYVVNYRISAEGYEDLEGLNVVRIYGVKDFGVSVVLKDDKLVVQDNDLNAIKNRIATYAASSEYEHYDKNDEMTSGILKTGDIIKIALNGVQAYAYRVAVLGDTSGDGKISYLDYVKVYNHIQKVKNPELNKTLLTEEYLLAADVSGDGKVNYLDYVKVYNKIKEQKEGKS